MYKELAQGFIAICCLFLCAGFASAQVTSLSTSNLIPVASVELGGPRINACSGKKLQGGSAYVTITSAKQTVYKKDSRFTQLFNRNRQVFSSYTVSAKYRTEDYSFSQVSEPVSLSGSQSSVDISSNWTLFNRVPWVINSAKLKMRLGYSADSTTDAMASAFSKITGSLPSFTLSTGAAVGLAITDTVDKLLFASDRSRNLLNASFDLPFAGNPLCDGYYAVFAAGDSNLYERYTS